MSMSTHVYGFRPVDSTWLRYKEIWDLCKESNIDPPNEVLEFFEHEYPNEQLGIETDIVSAVEEYNDIYRSGYIVNLEQIPKNVKKILFCNSW